MSISRAAVRLETDSSVLNHMSCGKEASLKGNARCRNGKNYLS